MQATEDLLAMARRTLADHILTAGRLQLQLHKAFAGLGLQALLTWCARRASSCPRPVLSELAAGVTC
jgi:hypothetical protein